MLRLLRVYALVGNESHDLRQQEVQQCEADGGVASASHMQAMD